VERPPAPVPSGNARIDRGLDRRVGRELRCGSDRPPDLESPHGTVELELTVPRRGRHGDRAASHPAARL